MDKSGIVLCPITCSSAYPIQVNQVYRQWEQKKKVYRQWVSGSNEDGVTALVLAPDPHLASIFRPTLSPWDSTISQASWAASPYFPAAHVTHGTCLQISLLFLCIQTQCLGASLSLSRPCPSLLLTSHIVGHSDFKLRNQACPLL